LILMTHRLRLIVMLVTALAIAVPAFAQIAQPTLRSTRPARGLFGGGLGDTSQSLILTGSLGGGIDKTDNSQIFDDNGVPTGETAPWTGGYASAMVGLSYDLSLGKVHTSAGLDARARYRDVGISRNFNAIGANANIGWDITETTVLSATQTYSRQPRNMQSFYGGWFDATTSSSPVFDLSGATSLRDFNTWQTAVTLQQSFTERISLNAGYSYFASSSDGGVATDSTTSTAAAGIAFRIARGVQFRIGYGNTVARYGSTKVRYGGLVMDGGLFFDRALSLTRRTSLSFSTGLTGARDQNGVTHYFVTGRGTLSYEIGRSWTSALNYRRGVDFNQNFGQPIVMDMVSAGIAGDLSRRFHLSSGVASSWGAIGIGAGNNGFNAVSFTANLRAAITRELGASLTYAYGHYLVDDPRTLPLGMRPNTDRQSIRATVDAWIPLFTRARRPDASR
jgi:hypothetical protein